MVEEPTKEITHAVRGITGQELEIQGTIQVDFLIGDRHYTHDFVVAPFPIKKDGIMGLDLLRALNARIDLATEEIELDGQKIKLTNYPPCRREADRRVKVCRTEPRPLQGAEEGTETAGKATTE